MRYRETVPAEGLRSLIRCYWFLSGAAPEAPAPAEPALPDGCPELILNLAAPFTGSISNAPARRQPITMLVGQITGPIRVRPTGPIDLVGVRFEPFGAAMLGLPLAALTDRWVDARGLVGGQLGELRNRLRSGDGAERAGVLDRLLTKVAAAATGPDPRVVAAVRAICQSDGAVPLDRLAAELGVSARTLQRLFAAEVGISPKLLARIARFQRVWAAWKEDPGNLARVAVACGYFDQPHLARDFRQFAGAAPAAFLAETPAFTAFFTAARAPA